MNKNYSLNDLISEDELYHHGIKGQKWGVRRYQNKDGSLTPAGKKRSKADIRRDKMNKLKDNDKLTDKERKIAEYGSLSKKEQWNMAAEKANKTLQERRAKQAIEDLSIAWVNSQIEKNPDLGVSKMETKQRQQQTGQEYLQEYASLTYNEIRARASEVKRLDKKYNEEGITYKQIKKEEKAKRKAEKKAAKQAR